MNEETIRAGADAAKEVAVTSGKLVDLAGKLTQYLDGTLEEYFGIAEDNMKFRRWQNRVKVTGKAEKFLREQGIDGFTRKVPVKFSLPLLTYATLEEDEELQDIWAQMLANAADASSRMELRTAYIEILKDLTTTDVQILAKIGKLSDSDLPFRSPPIIETASLPDHAQVRTTSETPLGEPSDDVKISLSNLSRAGCIGEAVGFGGMSLLGLVYITPLGLGLYRSCTKPKS
ncbi:MAG: DUF4393 domain-containing protein [Acidobacteria bacterium]|nr:DUF4393 domain-containing protein [Acidobacteriota bacterium]